ncbi:hypothetical protein Tco_0721537 [Tanacetum coccineum]
MELQDKSGASDADEPPDSWPQPAGWGFVPIYLLLYFALNSPFEPCLVMGLYTSVNLHLGSSLGLRSSNDWLLINASAKIGQGIAREGFSEVASMVIVGPGVGATTRLAAHMGSSLGLVMGLWNSRKLRKNGKWVISRIGGYTSLGFLGLSSLCSNGTHLFWRSL